MKRESVIFFENQFSVGADGWGMVAPYGDFPGIATEYMPNGQFRRFKAVQRITRGSAAEMVNAFHGVAQTVKRWLVGIPIYEGHPDAPVIGNRYPNKLSIGTVADLDARDDGLWAKPIFTNEGAALLDGDSRFGFSGRWEAVPVQSSESFPVFAPHVLKSVGITTKPNLPVEMLNECEPGRESTEPVPTTIMNKEKVIAWLKSQGVELANDASDEVIEQALGSVSERITTLTKAEGEKTALSTELANSADTVKTRDQELAAARAEFANERTERIKLMLETGVTSGRITAAQRPEWETKLTADFANASVEFAKLHPAVKTQPMTADVGSRKVEIHNATDRRQKAMDAVQTEMRASGCTYDQAFARVRARHPDLLGEGKGGAPAGGGQAPAAPAP